MLLHTIVVRIV